MSPEELKQTFLAATQQHFSGHLNEAEQLYRSIMVEHPQMPDPLHLLGAISLQRGRVNEALALVRRAIAIDATVPNYHNTLGLALISARQFEEAVIALKEALKLQPDMPEAHLNLGMAYQRLARLDESIDSLRTAMRLNPADPEIHNNLANSMRFNGQIDEAIAEYRRAIELSPSSAARHSNLAYLLQFHPAYDAKAILEEHRRWARLHAAPLKLLIRTHSNDRNPDRKLRVGYVSADFHTTVLAQFFHPLLKYRDREMFEIFCYSNTPCEDGTTDQLRDLADHWRHIFGLDDEQAAEQVRQDRIDILVDLTMHASGNRLLVFARKPAPIQVTYLSYPGTTGLDTIDYRLTDPYLDPPGANDENYSEKSFRLPKCYWCYHPLESSLEPGSPPVIESGRLTFGCLNGFGKVSTLALETWCRVLRAVPDSRLIVHSYDGSGRRSAGDLLKAHGVDERRLSFLGFVSVGKYFQTYQSIDIALDPFPYNGGTTTCDALWMGVPVVSLAGDIAVRRAGLSILSNLGFPELVARSTDEYVGIATELANDRPRLQHLRTTLRKKMSASPMMDAPGFTRDIENTYRTIWREWASGAA